MLDPISSLNSQTYQALPPQHQMEREIDAILKDPRLLDLLQNRECVVSVGKIGPHLYEIFTNEWRLIHVQVHYVPRTDGRVGPAQFELEFEPLQ
jgi:hypothetical protein